MAIYIPIPKEGNLTKGKYRFRFDVSAGVHLLPIWETPRNPINIPVVNKRFRVLRTYFDSGVYNVEIELMENPVPVGLIIGAIVALLLTFGGVVTLRSIERIVETTPQIFIIPLIIAIAVLIYIIKK